MKALIADDHNLIREGIKLILNRLLDTIDIFETATFDDTHKIVEENKDLDLIIMDLFMPGMSGPEGVSILRNTSPAVPIIVLSMSESIEHMRDSLKFGANGYIPKSSKNNILTNAINLVLDGGLYIPPEMLSVVTNSDLDMHSAKQDFKKAILTTRQTEVLNLLAEGRTNKEIARLLDISDKTVKSHTATIYRLLDADNRTQAVHHALQSGLIATEK